MQFLLDQNISFRVSHSLKNDLPELVHVSDVELLNSTDEKIWNFAKKENLTIITFDSDYFDLQTLKGFPPKIIWLRFGNTTTSEMIEFIKKNIQTFKQFSLSDKFSEVGCLEFH